MDLLAPELIADPHPHYHALRSRDPVHWSDRHRAWLLTRYDDVVAGFRNPAFSSERVGALVDELGHERDLGPSARVLERWMVFRDPPDHTRLRRLVQKAFTPRVAERMRPRIEAIVERHLDRLEARGGGDFVRDFAFPLPAIVISELLGIPPEDRDAFKRWSEDIKGLVFGSAAGGARLARARAGFEQLERYFARRLERVRDRGDASLLAGLAEAHERGDLLSGEELVATCILLLFGGHETTTNLISTGLWHLLRQPGARSRAIDAAAVEELLRYDGPIKLLVRSAIDDCEVRGRKIRAGDRVFLVQSAANRDPDQFPDPDRLDLGRSHNPHLAFGHGIHFCLGAPLARVEARVALGAVLERFPDIRVTTDTPQWQPTILSRALAGLPVQLS